MVEYMNEKNTCKYKIYIHDALGRLGSSEDTRTQVYVCDLKETHHYDRIIRNTSWDSSRHLNTLSRY